MELADLISDIVLGAIGLLVVFFLGHWFKSVNERQREHEDELKKQAINQIISSKDNERQDESLVEAKKANQKSASEFYQKATNLADSMSRLADSQRDNHTLIKENLMLIKQNAHRITNLEDKNEFIVKEIITKGRLG